MNAGPRRRRRVVDLGRVRASLARLDSLIVSSPELGSRTAAWMATDPDLDSLEALMPTDSDSGAQPVKLPPHLIARADDLVPLLAARPDLAAYGRVSRTSVVRLALARGLEALAADLAAPRPGVVTEGNLRGYAPRFPGNRRELDSPAVALDPDRAAVLAYRPRYPMSRTLYDRAHADGEARHLCELAARRILAELADDGVTMGAEEDAEAAVVALATLPNRPPDLYRAGAVLARAVAELEDEDGLTAATAADLATVAGGV